jgi:tRNA(Ile)-lysidine synthase TilS/MesJ
LRAELIRRGLTWREDASNASPKYLRNRLRQLLADRPALHDALIALGRACADWRNWLDGTAPYLPAAFSAAALHGLHDPLARHAARRWLRERGAPPDDLNAATLDRLLAMARDAATPARQQFPGALRVGRRRGTISAS